VVSVGASSSGFNRYLGWQSFGSDGGDAHTYFVNRIDRSFLQTLGMEVIGGRGFTETYPSDPDSMLVVNEALVRDFGWDDPVGRPVGHLGRVAGVIRDYNFESLHSAVEPMALFLMKREDEPMRFVYVRLTPGTTSETIDRLEAIWQRLVPDRPFDWYFLNDDLNRQYVSEQHTQRLLSAAGLFALAIACFGLFGLAAFAAERRTKEIGIRKVVGAGVPSLVALVAREFLVLVAIATCFAVPAAWAFLNRWLDGFANRVDIALWMPVAASVAALTIALLTVSYHAVRAATADPVGSLRAE